MAEAIMRQGGGVTLPDEDTLVIPADWRERLFPRRGGVCWKDHEAAGPAVVNLREAIDRVREHIGQVLADEHSEQPLVDGARRYLDGETDPLGAAAVATLAGREDNGGRRRDWWRMVVDAWIAYHGLPFAACAFAELARIWGGPQWSPATPLRFMTDADEFPYWWEWPLVARRIRVLLAAADDRDHQEAVRRLAGHRHTPQQRAVVSFLVPDRQDWVDECCAAPPKRQQIRWMLWCALGSADQIARLGDWARLTPGECSKAVLATLVEGVGPAVAPLLAEALDRRDLRDDTRHTLLEVLGALPTDEAFELLVQRLDGKHVAPALTAATRRFPVRTLRILVPWAADPARATSQAADMAVTHLRDHPELVAAALPSLPPHAREAVRSFVGTLERVPEAPSQDLPKFLVDPPWNRRRKVDPPVVTGLRPSAGRRVVWAPGEREKWSADVDIHWGFGGTDWSAEIRDLRAGRVPKLEPGLLLQCPQELVRPALKRWTPPDDWELWEFVDWTKPIVARFEADALRLALAVARLAPTKYCGVLLPFLDAKVARLMAARFARGRVARGTAINWFSRHGTAAVPLLVPAVLGEAGDDRRSAEAALRLLASEHEPDELVEAARVHGDRAADAIAELLAIDPLDVLPARPPRPGKWADPAGLPQVLLRDRRRALPDTAVRHLITMLAMSKPGIVYPGVPMVKELCDPASLAEFGWALFRRWEAAVLPREGWALTQLAWTGDDETARRLGPVIRRWPDSGHRRLALAGLDVLAEIGTEGALTQLHGIGQKLKYARVKSQAREKVREVAEGFGLTAEQLEDRLVPDLGLDAEGELTLDYGPRRFVVSFDEQLRPYVTDERGGRRKTLPKPGAKDDPELAAAAQRRFAELKKDVRRVAADQIGRLESAMVTGRRWDPAEFTGLFVRHPLMWHIARRLVWLSETGEGDPTAFRLAEDRTLADADDEAFTLPGSARVGVAHPAQLGVARKAWSETFADYEILQPFPQLARPVHTLSEAERAAGRPQSLRGRRVRPNGEAVLARRGWRCNRMERNGRTLRWATRHAPGGLHVVADLDEMRVGHVDTSVHPIRSTRPGFGRLDPATASEVIADLIEISEPGD